MTSVPVLCALVLTMSVLAAVPAMINYQGYLTDSGGTPVTGPVSTMAFALWTAESGGNASWSETHATVTVTNGVFNVLLGSVTPITLDFSQTYWLETTVNGETLSPRQSLVSVGYAFRAEYANNVDDADADATNELNTSVTFLITDDLISVLTITDAGGAKVVDLSSLNDDTDADADATNELNTTVTFDNLSSVLTITDAGGAKTVDLSSLNDDTDADADATNELNASMSFDWQSGMLAITDAGGTKTVFLGKFDRYIDVLDLYSQLLI